MSNEQWPPSGNGRDTSPWSHPDPGYRPTQFHDVQGRDPRQPFGQPPVAQPEPEILRPQRRPGAPLWIVLAAVAVIGALILGMQVFGGDPETASSSSPAASTAAEPSPTRTGNFIPFEGNGNGIFEIVRHEWTTEGLRLRIRVEIEEGEYQFGMFAFTNESREAFDPVDPFPFTVRAGAPYEADVMFAMPQADSTIVLATPSGRVALNALPVPGS